MVRSVTGKHGLYFEAVLQLRDTNQKIVDYVCSEIEKYKIPIAKIEEVRGGIDFYIADNAFTKSLGKRLQEKFGGELINTSSLHTEKKGKKLYRGTVMFRSASFRKGDFVEYGGDDYKVITLGKEILLQEKKSGKKLHVKYNEMNKIKKIE